MAHCPEGREKVGREGRRRSAKMGTLDHDYGNFRTTILRGKASFAMGSARGKRGPTLRNRHQTQPVKMGRKG